MIVKVETQTITLQPTGAQLPQIGLGLYCLFAMN